MSGLTELFAILGPETCKQMIRDADAEWEASEGICAEPYYGNVCEEDRPRPTSGVWCDEIPEADFTADIPLDPYGCANPVSGDEE